MINLCEAILKLIVVLMVVAITVLPARAREVTDQLGL